MIYPFKMGGFSSLLCKGLPGGIEKCATGMVLQKAKVRRPRFCAPKFAGLQVMFKKSNPTVALNVAP
jgi:hypothetical protein